MEEQEVERLRSWFRREARDLPWRKTPSPYAVWVSEVMLQQTQVAVVIDYFERWMQRFPTVAALAQASSEEVIKLWEGLGYYSRARNLHRGAQQLVEEHGGELPATREELLKITGIGKYTVGAILSFAFKQKAAAVDGNVMRVLSRFYGIEGEIERSHTQKEIWERAEALLPDNQPWEIAEALIELGASLCGRSARCGACPLKRGCVAYASHRQAELPARAPRKKAIPLYRAVALIEADGQVLLRCPQGAKLMQDLFEFPYIETDEAGLCPEHFAQRAKQDWGLDLEPLAPLQDEIHGFTRYRARLRPVYFHCATAQEVAGHRWEMLSQLQQLPFSAGHKRILSQLLNKDSYAHCAQRSLPGLGWSGNSHLS